MSEPSLATRMLPRLISAILLLAGAGQAWAASQIPFFPNVVNQMSDNGAAYLINKPGSAAGDVTLDVGDRLRGTFRIETIEDLAGPGQFSLLSSPVELTAVYDITVISKTFVANTPNGALHNYVYGPTPAAVAWAGTPGPAPASGTIIRFYEDTAKDFSRIIATDDGDPAHTGADIGVGPFATEEGLRARSTNGAPYWDLGFTGPVSPLYNNQPSPAAGEGWVSNLTLENVSLARLATLPINVGAINFALNVITNFQGPNTGTVPSTFGGTVGLNASASLLGIQGSTTAFDLFHDLNATFIPLGKGRLGDFVWEDVNGDGQQNAGEPGIPAATVQLFDCAGNLIASTLTDGNGLYQFTNLDPGNYRVKFIAPAGYSFTSQNQGSDTTDSDAGPTNGETACITLAAGETNNTVDAGLYRPAALGDRVWRDDNQNGLQDGVEPSLTNIQVRLYQCGATVPVDTTATDATGLYHFTNLAPGSYFVEFVLPGGYVFSPHNQGANEAVDSDAHIATGRTDCVTLAPGETNNDVDAGVYQPSTAEIGDFVWEDLNANGVQDANEPGVANVTVRLLDCSNNVLAATTTNASGFYLFSNLAAGNYTVEFVKPAGYFYSDPDQGADDTKDSDANGATGRSACATLANGQSNRTIDAGLYRPAAIGDFVWKDTNENGIQDGETGIEGVRVELYDCNDNYLNVFTTTTAGGFYGFINLVPGGYKVKFILPSGYVLSPLDQGSNDALDSDASGGGLTACVDLQSGETDNTIDAGMYLPSTAELGDFVWEDLNVNGVQDANETGIANVMVRLLDCSGNVINSTTTNSSGFYLFTNLAAGGYMVEFVLPAGYIFSSLNQGADDAVDSDADVTTGRAACVTLAQGESNRTVDAGMYRLAAIGDRVWNDANSNGIQDDGEAGVSAVSVQLRRCGNDSPVSTTATSGTGIYGFANLLPGDYYVVFSLPAGNGFTTSNAPGSTEANDSDANITGVTSCVTLVSGETNNDVDAGIVVLQPSVSIVKATNGDDADTPTGPYIPVGATVTWTYVVTNTGPVDLVSLAVTDNQGVLVSCPKTTLTPGESMTCTASGTAVAGQYANIGTVNGQSPAGRPVTASNPSHYFGSQPAIDIQKTPDNQTVPGGSTVTFNIVVTNTGNVTLTNVNVADAMAPNCNKLIGTLVPGASTSYTCTLASVAADLENIAVATGTPPAGGNVTDNDNAFVDVIKPAILIIKSPDMQTIVKGTTATFTIEVRNIGDVVLTNVTVADAAAPNCNKAIGTLNPGESAPIYNCTLANVTMDFTNVAVVTGTPPIGPNVTDDDDARVIVIRPAIDIRKNAEGPDSQTVVSGSTVTFTIVVTNTGDVPLSNVVVTDPLAPNCAKNIGNLAVGASDSYTCTVPNVTANFTNVATVTGQGGAIPVTDTDPSSVVVEAAGGGEGCTPGYWKQAHHFGSWTAPYTPSTLFSAVFENAFPGKTLLQVLETGGGGLEALGRHTVAALLNAASPGVSSDLTVSQVIAKFNAVFPGGNYEALKNEFAGFNEQGCPLGRNEGSAPAIDVEKYVGAASAKTDYDTAPGASINAGSPVTFTYVVKNTGNTPLTDIVVEDDMGVAVNCKGVTTLAPGASMTCTGTQAKAVMGLYTNIGMVRAADNASGNIVTDSDPANYTGKASSTGRIDIEKYTNGPGQAMQDADAAPGPYIPVGSKVIWTYVVKNVSTVKLTNIVVSDDKGVRVSCPATFLDAGKSMTCTGFGIATAGQYQNNGTVTAKDSKNITYTDSDLSHYFGKTTVAGGTGEGCTPGYWKQSQHLDSWQGYTPNTQFSAVFENAFPGKTLLQVLQAGGGGLEALGRHVVAALLNTSSGGVSYPVVKSSVVSQFNAAYPGENYEGLKNQLAGYNEAGCPLN